MNIKNETEILSEHIQLLSFDLKTLEKIAILFQEEFVPQAAEPWRKELSHDRLSDFFPALLTLLQDAISKYEKIEAHAIEIEEAIRYEQN